jgi:transcription factor C subunit 6
MTAPHTELVGKETASQYTINPNREILLLVGTGNSQRQHKLSLQVPVTLSDSETQSDDETIPEKVSGWMFDVGGVVLSVSWAPRPQATIQIIAMAVSPFADQDFDAFQDESTTEHPYHHGTVQIWTSPSDPNGNGVASSPRLWRTLLFNWGRVKKLLWCPVAPVDRDDLLGLLAVMCADGLVHVTAIAGDLDSQAETFGKSIRPRSAFGIQTYQDSRTGV